MNDRLPTLDEIENGHTPESAYFAGDVDALDAIDRDAARRAQDNGEARR